MYVSSNRKCEILKNFRLAWYGNGKRRSDLVIEIDTSMCMHTGGETKIMHGAGNVVKLGIDVCIHIN